MPLREARRMAVKVDSKHKKRTGRLSNSLNNNTANGRRDPIFLSVGHQEPASQNVNPIVTTIATAQAVIGWGQMMKGRFALEWQTAQHDAMNNKSTKHKNAQRWSTQIIQTIFEKWLELWRLRNEDSHRRDWHAQRIATKEQAIQEVEVLYEYKGRIMPTQEWIFNTTVEEQKLKTAHVLRAFVSNYKPVILGSYQTRLETG
jgi:hypothetical protein